MRRGRLLIGTVMTALILGVLPGAVGAAGTAYVSIGDVSVAEPSNRNDSVGIELPVTVDLKVVDTTPGINRATASAQVKPATLETGLVIQVPPFVNEGDKVRVNTETGEYQSRA